MDRLCEISTYCNEHSLNSQSVLGSCPSAAGHASEGRATAFLTQFALHQHYRPVRCELQNHGNFFHTKKTAKHCPNCVLRRNREVLFCFYVLFLFILCQIVIKAKDSNDS